MDLEHSFIKDNIEACRFTVICSGKGSGKSHLFLSFFKLFYMHKKYDKYILILPELETEIDKKYEFLRSLKDLIIYTEYDESIFIEAKEMSKQYKIFLCIDDATNIMFKNKNDEIITKIASTTRHGKGIALFLITHALSNILLPQVRALIDHLFIGVFGNMKIIKNSLYEENLSLIMKWEEFREMYVNNIVNREESHPFLYLNRKRQYDYNVHEWEMLQYYNKEIKPNGKAQIKEVNHKQIEYNKLKDDVRKSLIKKSLKPEKPKRLIVGKTVNL